MTSPTNRIPAKGQVATQNAEAVAAPEYRPRPLLPSFCAPLRARYLSDTVWPVQGRGPQP